MAMWCNPKYSSRMISLAKSDKIKIQDFISICDCLSELPNYYSKKLNVIILGFVICCMLYTMSCLITNKCQFY
jgi:hypothetical protein